MRDDERDSATLDTIFDVLSHRRRRRIVSYLDGTDSPLSVTTLADRLATEDPAATDGRTVCDATIRVTMVHTHLPKLADAGLIDYDPERDVIRPRDGILRTSRLLDAVSPENERAN